MNSGNEALRRRVLENLGFATGISRKTGMIRELFEAKLREHPLTTWSPTFRDPKRREVYAYGGYRLRGEFGVGDFVGSYDLMLYADGTDLANSQIEVFGTVDGVGQIKFELPFVASIMKLDRSGLDELLAKINYLESILEMVGLLPGEKVDSEENEG